MSKCSLEIRQELLKSNKIWEEKLRHQAEMDEKNEKEIILLRFQLDKIIQIFIKNNLISDIDEI
ncbi:hypothetical protein [Spiroplasma alleghenense]|uniref:Uncharacterized protein n=1 Tax=Spiroplasma alleghenense TaxID=216931 RepID=A0A345Z503_9MOLU|nr:hypothetical protein [Spiroplasma alleghenense]AXK51682.1 hypothetical protein SALLE_v1c10120 [Spiroplasma alleghenense]